MPAASKVRKTRTSRKPRRSFKKRLTKRSSNVADFASLSTKRSMRSATGPNFDVNTLYSLMDTQLADFQRAEIVASQYQHFRIKKIALTVKPTYDTFAPLGNGGSKTNLYYMIDKSGAIPSNITLEGLKQMGARPKQLDEKNLTITWTPSVLGTALTANGAPGVQQNAAASYKLSPWLSTQSGVYVPGAFVPSIVDHLGLYWYVDQLTPNTGTQYSVEVEVQFQFKKPLAPYNVGAPQAVPALLAIINNSPDGVEGGGDGR